MRTAHTTFLAFTYLQLRCAEPPPPPQRPRRRFEALCVLLHWHEDRQTGYGGRTLVQAQSYIQKLFILSPALVPKGSS